VIYLGGWNGSGVVTQTSAYLQGQATGSASGKVRLFVAADQEGGQVQQLKGSGFTTMPSALSQGQSSQSSIEHNGATVGVELKRAGVNIDLPQSPTRCPPTSGPPTPPSGATPASSETTRPR